MHVAKLKMKQQQSIDFDKNFKPTKMHAPRLKTWRLRDEMVRSTGR
jgi:hypothetical protein